MLALVQAVASWAFIPQPAFVAFHSVTTKQCTPELSGPTALCVGVDSHFHVLQHNLLRQRFRGASDIIVTLISSAISFVSVLPVLFLLRGGSFENAPLSDIELKRMAAGLPKLHGRWPLWGPRFAYAFGYGSALEVVMLTLILDRCLLALTLTMLIFVYGESRSQQNTLLDVP